MFSGGKDSVAALLKLQGDDDWCVERLVTTFNAFSDRIALHGTPLTLMRAQARALALPLIEIALPGNCDNQTYLARVADALAPLREAGLRHVAFGDLFLEDIREFREHQMQSLELTPLFPLWHTDTAALARQMIDGGVRARVCCVDQQKLPAELLGRQWDNDFVDELPGGVDPCGENGEFHTLVIDAPNMKAPLAVKTGDIHVSHDRFCMLDFQPA